MVQKPHALIAIISRDLEAQASRWAKLTSPTSPEFASNSKKESLTQLSTELSRLSALSLTTVHSMD